MLYEAWDAQEPGHGHAEAAAAWRVKRDALPHMPDLKADPAQ
jgi:hypothetical protein